jgi:hypothetical protein
MVRSPKVELMERKQANCRNYRSSAEGDNFGDIPALGLATYCGKLPTAASWQRVLAEKQILKPTPGRFGAPASSRVVYG